MTDPIVQRQAARAILLTPADEVLLLRLLPPGAPPCWLAPGGGLEAGESLEAGLRRELKEEVGLDDFEMGPLLWRRSFHFDRGGRRFCQREGYYAVRVPRFEPVMSDVVESRYLHSFRWWPAAELAGITERLFPPSLATIVARYLSLGPPPEPLEEEVVPG